MGSDTPFVDVQSDSLRVAWSDGTRSLLHAIWLRDNCPCHRCRDPRSGQRLIDVADLDAGAVIDHATPALGGIDVTFVGDGHRAHFSWEWLRRHRYDEAAACVNERGIVSWGRELSDALPCAHYTDVVADRDALRRWLSHVCVYGVALLRGAPRERGQVTRVAELFGFVRETNYGRLFDVEAVAEANNLAYTGLPLGVHTDNPYRDPVPGLQLLHCLEAAGSGGESILVDGFRAARALADTAADHFALLSRYDVPFRFRDHGLDLRCRRPMIAVSARGEITAIAYNNRSMAPLDLPESIMPAYYAAYREFSSRLRDPAGELALRLQPGDLLLLDNQRVLHGRSGFAAGARRHLQGCYADRDALWSLVDSGGAR